MINFFRKIRKQFADDNNPIKYLRYAFGEIVLVMIGILLALQVNNWNESRSQQKIVKAYLTSYIEDLKDDLKEYREKQDQCAFKFHSLQYILLLSGEKPVENLGNQSVDLLSADNSIWNKPIPKTFNKAFIDLAFLWSVRGIDVPTNKTSMEELKSTGSFTLIENKALTVAINKYYKELEWRFEGSNLDYFLRVRNNWQESLLKSGVLAQDVTNVEDPIGLIQNNLERIGYLRAVIRSAWFQYGSAKALEENAVHLISLIESEIEK